MSISTNWNFDYSGSCNFTSYISSNLQINSILSYWLMRAWNSLFCHSTVHFSLFIYNRRTESSVPHLLIASFLLPTLFNHWHPVLCLLDYSIRRHFPHSSIGMLNPQTTSIVYTRAFKIEPWRSSGRARALYRAANAQNPWHRNICT